ncbi:nucleotidyltransferase family protein [uncultured Sphingomonas sp.]|uniref:nucleotidyltransferase domain-containing protein n=1 Tax=uncultured Sphingomonas sp. TaxID=158754 RepID=UPI0025E36263|nr:nucleotidyltransferase family protein [uncultured Sphingomonas sp.]
MRNADALVRALRDPASTATLDGEGWTQLIAIARAEQLAGTLADRVRGVDKAPAADRLLAAAYASAEQGRVQALWEAEMARRALSPLGLPVVALKGTAYVAAGLAAGRGRSIGDLDILVPRSALDDVERALLAAGWEWVRPDPYDDAYYRRWMHELPPLIHRERDRMIDVHHTVLPLTARITPNAGAMLADAVVLKDGLAVLSGDDMICHSAAHLFADGDLAGGLRNLWDLQCLFHEVATPALWERARMHGLEAAVARAWRLANSFYVQRPSSQHSTPSSSSRRRGSIVAEPAALSDGSARIDPRLRGEDVRSGLADRLYRRRLLARDGWGRATRPVTRLAFFVRSHWLRMPPAMLARHLFTKWRKGHRASG